MVAKELMLLTMALPGKQKEGTADNSTVVCVCVCA